MKVFYLHIILLVLFLQKADAQQIGLSNQYLLNPYSINPAYAGSKGVTQGLLGQRKQWVGFDGAPEYKYISIQSKIYKAMGLGVSAGTESLGLLKKFHFSASYAYEVTLTQEHILTFGLSGIYREKSFNFNALNVDDASDANLSNQGFNRANNFNADFGIAYKFNALNIGVSVQNLLPSKATYDNNPAFYQDVMHIQGIASYAIGLLNNKMELSPFAKVAMQPSASMIYEGGLMLDYQKKIALAVVYRSNSSMFATLSANISNTIQIGYSFEPGFGKDLYSYGANTHEFFLGFTIGSKSKNTELERAQAEANALKHQSQSDSLSKIATAQKQEMERLEQALKEKDAEYQAQLSELEKQKNKPAETQAEKPVATTTNLSTPESGSEVTPDQLGKGHYVVVRSFLNKQDAQKSLTEIISKGYKPFLVFNKNRGYYYIYLEKFDNLSTALKELENVKSAGFTDAWLYLHQ